MRREEDDRPGIRSAAARLSPIGETETIRESTDCRMRAGLRLNSATLAFRLAHLPSR
jgi:hypothetical protein